MASSRIETLIRELKKTPNSFANEIGVANTVIYNIIRGRRTSPSFELLRKIKSTYPQVNMNWIIGGTGTPFIAKNGREELAIQIMELTNAMRQMESLDKLRDQHIGILKEKINTLKSVNKKKKRA